MLLMALVTVPRPGAAASLADQEIERRPAAAAAEQAAEPFGDVAPELIDGPIAEKWRGVQRAVAAEAALLDLCRATPVLCPAPAALEFLAIVNQAVRQNGLAGAGEINRAVNLDIRPAADFDRFQVEDVWSSPIATLSAGAGDCEDYAIAKYAALRAAGIGPDDLRLVILRDPARGEDHAVATVRIEGRWRVLDNRRLVMRDDRAFSRWRPLFVLSEAGVRRYLEEALIAAVPLAVQPYF